MKIKWPNLRSVVWAKLWLRTFFIYLVIISEKRLLTLKYFLIFLDSYNVSGNFPCSSSRHVFENRNVLVI